MAGSRGTTPVSTVSKTHPLDGKWFWVDSDTNVLRQTDMKSVRDFTTKVGWDVILDLPRLYVRGYPAKNNWYQVFVHESIIDD